jgi:hypothetical protein
MPAGLRNKTFSFDFSALGDSLPVMLLASGRGYSPAGCAGDKTSTGGCTMFKKSTAALVAAGAVCTLAPTLSIAGGEIQEYERTSRTTTYSGAASQYTNNAPPPSYARPMGAYYAPPMSPCGTMPYGGGGYGYGYYQGGGACSPCGGGGGLFGSNPVFTAGLLGVGIGYLLWH